MWGGTANFCISGSINQGSRMSGATERAKTKLITYTGPSMNPTLKSGDRLFVVPYDDRRIRLGDVVVFFSPENGNKITHRVISAHSKGIRTQGDHNISADPWVLSPDRILGRVKYVQRGTRRRGVFGGKIGLLFAGIARVLRMVDSSMSSLLHPAYDWLSKSGTLRRLLRGQTKTRGVSFNRAGGAELQLLLGSRVVGKWMPRKRQWRIQRPFRLFVDEAALPDNPPEAVHREQITHGR